MEMTVGAYLFSKAMLADGVKPVISLANPGYDSRSDYDPDYDIPQYKATVKYRGYERTGYGYTMRDAWNDLMINVSRYGIEGYKDTSKPEPMDLRHREEILSEMTCEVQAIDHG